MALRIRAFMDYWNFELDMRAWDGAYKIDYDKLSGVLIREAANVLGFPDPLNEGVRVYASINPLTPQGRKQRDFFNNALSNKTGYQVRIIQRRTKRPPKCNNCNRQIEICPHCGEKIVRTVEKGVDTGIVTELMQGAWDDTYDAAILLSSDRDYIPAVEYLQTRGKKIVHAGFGQSGHELPTKCWGRIQLHQFATEMRRP